MSTFQPSLATRNDTVALPVLFTMFLYAGLAGILLIFVVCVMRMVMRHYQLCNFKLSDNDHDSSIEIIREADIDYTETEISLATVVSPTSTQDDHIITFKSFYDDTENELSSVNKTNKQFSTISDGLPTIAQPVHGSSRTSILSVPENMSGNYLTGSRVRTTACAMTVMETVMECTNQGTEHFLFNINVNARQIWSQLSSFLRVS